MALTVERLEIPDVLILEPKRHGDTRGFFSETYQQARFAEAGVDCAFVQDNHAKSAEAGTLRGVHFQAPPHAQAKLVRVVRGAIFDVAVDIRRGSPTFGKWVSAVLSAENGRQIFVPRGFAHGLLTLEPETEVIYKVDGYYAPDHDFGLAWDDPDIGVDWPLDGRAPILSGKDAAQPRLAGLPVYFEHGAVQ